MKACFLGRLWKVLHNDVRFFVTVQATYHWLTDGYLTVVMTCYISRVLQKKKKHSVRAPSFLYVLNFIITISWYRPMVLRPTKCYKPCYSSCATPHRRLSKQRRFVFVFLFFSCCFAMPFLVFFLFNCHRLTFPRFRPPSMICPPAFNTLLQPSARN